MDLIKSYFYLKNILLSNIKAIPQVNFRKHNIKFNSNQYVSLNSEPKVSQGSYFSSSFVRNSCKRNIFQSSHSLLPDKQLFQDRKNVLILLSKILQQLYLNLLITNTIPGYAQEVPPFKASFII